MLAEATRAVLGRLRGSFSVAVISADEPDTIVAACRHTPLVLGLHENMTLLASDIPALIEHTRRVFTLADDQMAVLTPGALSVTTLEGDPVEPEERTITWDLEAARKDGFEDFMSKEIHEQPAAVGYTLLDRRGPGGELILDEMRLGADELRAVDKVFIVACGSSYHAALVAKYAIEHWVKVPTEVDIASEFRYRDPVLNERTLCVGVSQSGETLDTAQAVREAARLGAKVLVVSNVVDSSMARGADGVLYTRQAPRSGWRRPSATWPRSSRSRSSGSTWRRSTAPAGVRRRRRSSTRWRCCPPWSRRRSAAPATWTTWRPSSPTHATSSSSAATSGSRWRSRARSS